MIKRYCDLCGKAFSLYKGYTLDIYDNKKTVTNRDGSVSFFNEEENAMETYDVCEECRQALTQFMVAQFMGGRNGENTD